jgi:hypothetical protein
MPLYLLLGFVTFLLVALVLRRRCRLKRRERLRALRRMR